MQVLYSITVSSDIYALFSQRIRQITMKMKEVLQLLGVTYVSLHRYMKNHPKLGFRDTGTFTGHPFPQPIHKEGRELVWDDDQVNRWVEDNAKYVGKRALRGVRIKMPYIAMRMAMRNAEIPELDVPSDDNANDEESWIIARQSDHMTQFKILGFDGDDYDLEFDSVDEAIMFKLKYS